MRNLQRPIHDQTHSGTYILEMMVALQGCIPMGSNGADRPEAAASIFHALPSMHAWVLVAVASSESQCLQDIVWCFCRSERASRILSKSTRTKPGPVNRRCRRVSSVGLDHFMA
ncbi:hypothetical protein H6P81_001491 [Aristolochia fimbriata]|uniref:Uncharacterized protein n=1 Tax=Aristolochia fimbriata TaxID=158543 RepID=A0AAV7F7C1_ARIFI|nr:hypothetical protein H6P81_001491 [Aristolochia fimbriata]